MISELNFVHIQKYIVSISVNLTGVEQAQLPDNGHDQEQQSGTYLDTVCTNWIT